MTEPPFYLDSEAQRWVTQTFDSLSLSEKIGQVLHPLRRAVDDPARLDELLADQVGGVYRPTALPPEVLREGARYLQQRSRVPLLFSADLEFDEGRAIGGTADAALPNQLTQAATADPDWARQVAAVAAAQARWCGYHWAFGPVVDLDLNPDNPVVNTRSYGSDQQTVIDFGTTYLTALQAAGVAACAKHWPGDGVDDRDQHLVTSVNSLDLAQWRSSYGAVYQAMIDAGVRTIMSGHIALPGYPQLDPGTPATLSPELNLRLLRDELGFRGLIVSDASEMAGFTDHGPRRELVPRCIAAGCDILLFNQPGDAAHLRDGLARGALSQQRLDEAVRQVLRLKASLGLHRAPGPANAAQLGFDPAPAEALANDIAEAAVTLVRDDQALLPLSPQTHQRLLLIIEPHRRNVFGSLPPLRIPELLRAGGFEVTVYHDELAVTRERFDALLYVVAQEAKQGKVTLRLRWDELHGRFPRLMERHWHTLPTAFISLGSPYHGHEVPQCLTLVNGYSPVPAVQAAVVRALTGEIPFAGTSPVDPYRR